MVSVRHGATNRIVVSLLNCAVRTLFVGRVIETLIARALAPFTEASHAKKKIDAINATRHRENARR